MVFFSFFFFLLLLVFFFFFSCEESEKSIRRVSKLLREKERERERESLVRIFPIHENGRESCIMEFLRLVSLLE